MNDEQFDFLWAQYPKRQGNLKGKSRKLIERHIQKGHATYEEILAGTIAYARHIERESQRPKWRRCFIKQAQTFFGPSQHWEGYEDEPDPEPQRESAADRIRRKAQEGGSVIDVSPDNRRLL